MEISVTASQRIRSATRDAHVALEQTPIVKLLMSRSLSVYGYWQVLDNWLNAWAPLEKIVTRACPPEFAVYGMPTMRTRLLRQDLRGIHDLLGETPSRGGVLITRARAGGELANLAARPSGWLGLAYVLQGSALGGAVVASHLQQTLPQNATNCIRFFCPQADAGIGVATQFRRWLQWLDSELTDPTEQQYASYAAIRTFDYLSHAWATDLGER